MSPNQSQSIPLSNVYDFPGGVHPPENKKQSTRTPIARPPLPDTFILPLNQHSGAPAELLVKAGDSVLKGQMLARASGFVSAPVHAPTSGTVESIGMHPVPHWSGLEETCLILKADGEDRWCRLDPVLDYRQVSREELVQRIHDAGVVGLGGAGFPAAVKMSSRKASKIHTLIVNGAECEPYITADDMLMREQADRLLGGIEILRHMLEPREVLIGIEDNKPEAIAAMHEVCSGKDNIKVVPVPTKYPSGDAQRLIWLLTGKEVPSDARSIDIGMLCYNVGTLVAVYDAIVEGRPLISRITTLTGAALNCPGNVETLIGTPVEHLLEFADVQDDRFDALVMGGPMMGHTLDTTAVPVIKTSNCFIAATREEFPPALLPQACIRCGKCADACPLTLLPQQLYWHAKSQNHEQLQQHNLSDCIECGACAYVCPSSIPLVQYFRAAKDEIRFQKTKSDKAERSRQRFEQRQKRLEAQAAEKEARRKANAEKARRLKEAKAGEENKATSAASTTPAASSKEDLIKAAMERARAKKAARASGDATPNSAKSVRPQLSPQQKELKIQLYMVKAQIKKCERAAAQSEESSPEALKLNADISKLQEQLSQLQTEFDNAASQTPAQIPAKATRARAGSRPELSADEKKRKIELAMARAAAKKAEKALAAAQDSDSDRLNTLKQQLEDKRRELARCEEAE